MVVGNQGLGGVGNCSVDAVDVAIHSDSSGKPATKLHSVNLQLPGDDPPDSIGSSSSTFVWSRNVSSVLSFDIIDRHSASSGANPTALELDFGRVYWLRVRMAADYRGNTGTAKCLINWALSSATKTGYRCLWQEAGDGAYGELNVPFSRPISIWGVVSYK